MIENDKIQLEVAKAGYIKSLIMKEDQYHMNWVIDNQYLKQNDYNDSNKLFGQFKLTIDGNTFESYQMGPQILQNNQNISVIYTIEKLVKVEFDYFLDQEGQLVWTIKLINLTSSALTVNYFGVWISFAYIMFRDKNVARNMHQSTAVFPSISTNFTKLNLVRRDNAGMSLGLYQIKGETKSIGTYCDYDNKFFENVSPSLDGMLFHQLILAGGYDENNNPNDWIYSQSDITLGPDECQVWQYVMNVNDNTNEFYKNAKAAHHPVIVFDPLSIIGQEIHIKIDSAERRVITVKSISGRNGQTKRLLNQNLVKKGTDNFELTFVSDQLGEHKIEFTFDDGTSDFIVLNVMPPLDQLLETRVDYLSTHSYLGPDGEVPYAFTPVSNQGESLGKLNLILKKNLLGQLNIQQVQQVEASAVHYVKQKWFQDGDLRTPAFLYGSFYRCMDFEYIGHLFYLLSEFDEDVLQINQPNTYLKWAADVFELRVDPDLHETDRGKEEAQMLGVYFLYIDSLLNKLKAHHLTDEYHKINELWTKTTRRIASQSKTYNAAITEHFYDNAGFGPTAGAMSSAKQKESAELYGELLLANIGISNDFRAQNPDRWWEALSYMIHSLWGGITSASAYKVFELNNNIEYLKASYRSLPGILYCYDNNATATTPISTGMAASTYSVAGPHINRPDLSRARFGQATFHQDGGIFKRLFTGNEKTSDWDMGEELVAYLDGIGQKTFVIYEDNDLQVINGTYSYQNNQIIITSFTPYQAEVYLIKSSMLKKIGITDNNHQIKINEDELK